ncbi:inverse autotransporter beta domain-containing protein, partial [Salmonella enterica]|nr:inverse autotransporter beta domain-containing protein [Salmonella enterica]
MRKLIRIKMSNRFDRRRFWAISLAAIQLLTPIGTSIASVKQSIDNSELREDDHQLANNLALAAGLLQDKDNSMAAIGYATSLATGAANQAVGKWLNQFGTARINLSIDKKLKTKGSSLDLQVPLYDSPGAMFFTQLGVRNKESTNTLNFGLGVRTFYDNGWMYGANIFFDDDITRHNRRISLGAEAWTDYLKLSANQYFGLTDWHQSRDLVDYDERPADGWDIRAHGWLPSYPQLGGKLVYEKFHGNEVAIGDLKNRSKNPSAVTVGIDWSPFPLLTLGVDQRMGSAGNNDSQANLSFTIRPGDSLAKHFDTDAVAATRLLKESRTDLVERNNDIVLDYRKQEVLTLNLPNSLSGAAREQLTVQATVKSKHGLSSIDWQSPQLIADGGTLKVLTADRLALTLPPRAHITPYILSGVARDNRGNVSERKVTYITITGENIASFVVSKSVMPATLPADGKSTAVVRVVINNDKGLPVSGRSNDLSSQLTLTTPPSSTAARIWQAFTSPVKASISEYREFSPGVYEATLTSGTEVGVITVDSSLAGTKFKETVNIVLHTVANADTATIEAGSLAVVTDNAVANGTAANSVRA